MPVTSAHVGDRDSSEWRRFSDVSVERTMLLALESRLGFLLRPRSLVLTQGSRVEVEGIDADDRVVVQLVANQGGYKPAYRNKVMSDMFKLLWLRNAIPTAERAILVVTAVTVQALSGWVAVAAADLGVEVYLFDGESVIPLTAES